MHENGCFHKFPLLSDELDKVNELSWIIRSAVVRPARVVEVGYCLVDAILGYFKLTFYPSILRGVAVNMCYFV